MRLDGRRLRLVDRRGRIGRGLSMAGWASTASESTASESATDRPTRGWGVAAGRLHPTRRAPPRPAAPGVLRATRPPCSPTSAAPSPWWPKASCGAAASGRGLAGQVVGTDSRLRRQRLVDAVRVLVGELDLAGQHLAHQVEHGPPSRTGSTWYRIAPASCVAAASAISRSAAAPRAATCSGTQGLDGDHGACGLRQLEVGAGHAGHEGVREDEDAGSAGRGGLRTARPTWLRSSAGAPARSSRCPGCRATRAGDVRDDDHARGRGS